MVVFLFHGDHFERTALFAIANGQRGYLPDTGIFVSAQLFTASLHAKNPFIYVAESVLEDSSHDSSTDAVSEVCVRHYSIFCCGS